MDLFQEKLEFLSKSDHYAKALQKPQLQVSKPSEMFLDYEFARLYKILEGSITRTLTTRAKDEQTKPSDTSLAMLAQYSQWIQYQNQQILAYQEQEKQFHEERESMKNRVLQLEHALQASREQHNRLQQSSEQGLLPRGEKRERLSMFDIFV